MEDNTLSHRIQTSCLVKKLNDSTVQVELLNDDGFIFELSMEHLDQALLTDEAHTGHFSVDLSFEVDCKNGSYYVVEKTQSLSILDISLKINDSQLITIDPAIIAYYSLQGSDFFDQKFIETLNNEIARGTFDEQFRLMPKGRMDWSIEEAKAVFAIFNFSKYGNNEDVKIQIKSLSDKYGRSESAIVFKLAQFRNLASGGEQGLDNIGQVFVDVFNKVY